MKDQVSKLSKEIEKAKETELVIHEVEVNAIIVNLQGWRMRVYFEDNFKEQLATGRTIKVNYFGDINDPHSVKFEKLNK